MKAVSHLNSLGHQLKWILKKCKQVYKYLANGPVTKKQEKNNPLQCSQVLFFEGY